MCFYIPHDARTSVFRERIQAFGDRRAAPFILPSNFSFQFELSELIGSLLVALWT